MSTIQTITDADTPADTMQTKINDNFSALNTDKAELSGATFTGDINVPDEAYNATTWNGSTEVPTKNAIRDKIEALAVLSDGDKGDITLSSSGTVWTIDNSAVTTAKLGGDITTAGKALLDDADASAQRTTLGLSTTANQTDSTDKRFMTDAQETKLDGLSQEWTLDKTGSFTAGGTYDSGTLTTYDEYKVEIQSATTAGSGVLRMQHNSNGSAQYSKLSQSTSGSFSNATGATYVELFTTTGGSGYIYNAVLFIERTTGSMRGDAQVIFDASFNSSFLTKGYRGLSVTSLQLSTCSNISGDIKIYGRNY